MKIPVIQDIHTKILEVVSVDGALKMNDWHTCDTTHCRAGWVVHLAGKDGYELEKETDTCFAAMMIYKKSSEIKVGVNQFFVTEKEAMSDIKRCAELEASQN